MWENADLERGCKTSCRLLASTVMSGLSLANGSDSPLESGAI